MKINLTLTTTAVMTLMPLLKVLACGPYFPVSYFPQYRSYIDGFTTTEVSTNSAEKCFDAYRVTPHLGTELAMIGAHYYPAWTGKAPKGNRVSTTQADELDFFAAGTAAGISKADITKDWQRFVMFRDGVCKRLERGEKVEVPKKIPDYALEFYLYKLGHAQWLVFRKDEDPKTFGKLLALPKERRLYRTVWVHFVRIANARKYSDKDQHIDALRRAVDAGCKDTAGLEAFTLNFLTHTCGHRYDPLVLTAYAHAPWEDWPDFAKRIFISICPTETFKKKQIDALCSDTVGVEVAVAYGAGGILPANVVRPENPVLGADRQAWIAFSRGELDLCRKLLAMSPKHSLIRLFLEARLDRLDGDYKKAAEHLHEWLEEYRQKGSQSGNAMTGYVIGTVNDNYWYTGRKTDGEYGFSEPIHYSGIYGPSGKFFENVLGYFRDYAEPQSHEPTLSRIVSGELGMVMVATRDLEEALYAFLLARNWIDIAFVAERCMTVNELMKFMNGNRIDQHDKELLSGLLMRRLMRCGRTKEAAAWVPEKLKPIYNEFCALSSIANDPKTGADDRAVAFLNLSRLIAVRGMELTGTELRPDVAVFDGEYSYDGIPFAEPADLSAWLDVQGADLLWGGWNVPDDRVQERFHYRRKSIEYAKASVKYANNADVRAWALMFGGVVSLSLDDAQTADWFYKKLASMRHPRAKVGTWFNGPEYRWFKKKFYDDERHRCYEYDQHIDPTKVPQRLTIKQLAQLKAPNP